MSMILLIVNKLSTPLLKALIYNKIVQGPDTYDYCGLKSEIQGERL